MRTIVLLLLLANFTLFGYTRLDSVGSGESMRLAQQVRPDAIKLLTAQQVAALGPSKIAALADVCIEWGPFGEGDRARALTEMEPLALGRLLTQKKVETNPAFWVYLPRLASKQAAERRLVELQAAGLRDAAVVDTGPQRLAISLAAFRAEETANAYVKNLERIGIANAQVMPRQQSLAQTALVIRDPNAATVARLKALQPQYPESEIRIGACDKSG